MLLILARHGNTFERHEKSYMVGCHEDLPLTAEGELQAQALRDALAAASRRIQAVYCGSLKRQKRFAEIVAQKLTLDIQIDKRLNELDYGQWNGLTSPEIKERFGTATLAAWNDCGTIPQGQGWALEEEINTECRSFMSDLAARHSDDQAVLSVTSNGRIRFFLKQFPQLWTLQQPLGLKVSTGAVCGIQITASGAELRFWNAAPSTLAS